MIKGESVVVERVVNGFIINPKEVTSLTKNEKDIYIFETLEGLKKFLDKHFNGQGEEKK